MNTKDDIHEIIKVSVPDIAKKNGLLEQDVDVDNEEDQQLDSPNEY